MTSKAWANKTALDELRSDDLTLDTLTAENVVATDDIIEHTPGAGVTVDGVLMQDNEMEADAIRTDTISEKTNNNGVLIAGVLLKNGVVAPSARPLLSGTLVTASSQAAIEFTVIPEWVTKITIGMSGLSSSSTSTPIVQLGHLGGYETTNYSSFGIAWTNTGVAGIGGSGQGGFVLTNGVTASGTLNGMITLMRVDANTNTWVCSSTLVTSPFVGHVTGGNKSLSATLDRLRLYIDGAQTFDAGSVNILYE